VFTIKSMLSAAMFATRSGEFDLKLMCVRTLPLQWRPRFVVKKHRTLRLRADRPVKFEIEQLSRLIRDISGLGTPLTAWTLGVANSSAPLPFFVDADCQVDKAAFSALLRGFARPAVGVVAARGDLGRRRSVNSLVERSETFSALMLHEIKSRLAAAWAVVRARLWSERSRGQLHENQSGVPA
jgi:hypothetical protein